MKTQLKKIKKAMKGMSTSTYVAAFQDGTVSDPICNNCTPPPCEGNYVSIFKKDKDDDILAKLGSLHENKFYND